MDLEADLQEINGAMRKRGTTCLSFKLPAPEVASLQRDGSRLFFCSLSGIGCCLEMLYWSFADM